MSVANHACQLSFHDLIQEFYRSGFVKTFVSHRDPPRSVWFGREYTRRQASGQEAGGRSRKQEAGAGGRKQEQEAGALGEGTTTAPAYCSCSLLPPAPASCFLPCYRRGAT